MWEFLLWSHLTILLFLIYNKLWKSYLQGELINSEILQVPKEEILDISDLPKFKDYLNCLGTSTFGNFLSINLNSNKGNFNVYNYTYDYLIKLTPQQVHECLIKLINYDEDFLLEELDIPHKFKVKLTKEGTDIKGMINFILELKSKSKKKFNLDTGQLFNDTIGSLFPFLTDELRKTQGHSNQIKVEALEPADADELTELEKEMKAII